MVRSACQPFAGTASQLVIRIDSLQHRLTRSGALVALPAVRSDPATRIRSGSRDIGPMDASGFKGDLAGYLLQG